MQQLVQADLQPLTRSTWSGARWVSYRQQFIQANFNENINVLCNSRGPLRDKSISDRWIPITKGSKAESIFKPWYHRNSAAISWTSLRFRIEIWQVSRQHYYGTDCKTSRCFEYSNIQSRRFETKQCIAIRRITRRWHGFWFINLFHFSQDGRDSLRAPIYSDGFTIISAWISNLMPGKMRDEIA